MSQINKLIIYYFSGTGNAKKSAEWIAETMHKNDIPAEIFNIADKTNPELVSSDNNLLLGFCFPTHGFNAPPIMLRFLSQLPHTKNNTRVFLLNTRAGMKISKIFTPGLSGLALILPTIILRLKGYQIIGYRPVDLPSNWISVHPGLKQTVINSIVKRCERITKRFAQKIIGGKKVYRGLYDLPVDLLISPIALAYYFYGRFMLSKTFIATDACNNCGICEKECPVNAISMKNNLPYWSYNCESCMHCMNACPQRAIETPHGFTALIWWIAFSLIPILLMKYIFHFFNLTSLQNEVVYNAIQLILGAIFIFGAYKLMHYLMKYKAINKMVTYTSLTKFKFWRRYKGPVVK